MIFWCGVAVIATFIWLRLRGPPDRPQASAIAIGTVVLACAGFAGEVVVSWRQAQVHQGMLTQVRLMASGLDRETLLAHRGIPDDVGQPWFTAIKGRLQDAKAANPSIVFAYLLEPRGGVLQFPNDDDPVDMEGYEPPGTVYDDAPDGMFDAVVGGREFALGPYQDRWGEFFTVGVPIRLAPDRLQALAVDLRADAYRLDLWLWRLWPLALGIAAALVASLWSLRAAALTQARASAAQAEAANRAKDAYLATVSHDLRQPLGGIIGMTGLLAETDLTPDQRDYVQLAHDSGQQLLGLVNELLDYAQIEAGTLTIDRGPLDVREVVEDCVALLSPVASGKGVELDAIIAHDLPDGLLGDPDRLRQVVQNLIGNAVKFTDEGAVVVRVDGSVLDGRVRIAIAVQDSGIGIDAKTLAQLFRPFSQGSESRRRKGGTGLGLVIAKRIAKAMDGDVSVQSEPGRGSTFTVNLMLDRDPEAPHSALRVAAERRGARVLLGIGAGALCDSISEHLLALGVHPVLCADGSELAAQQALSPAAALIDSRWPSASATALREAGVPVSLISASSSGGTQLIATRRMPSLLRPVRRAGLARVLATMWDPQAEARRQAALTSVSSRRFAVHKPESDYEPLKAPMPVAEAPAPPRPASGPRVAVPGITRERVVGGLLGGLRGGLDAVQDAARAGDLHGVARAARGLRGAAEPICLTELVDTCLSLEQAALANDRSAVTDIVSRLDAVRQRTQAELTRLKHEPQNE
jgi:signal transduction histidine kinase